MRKVALLAVVGLLCISLSSLAGEVITNDTGEDAIGLQVVFSESVTITAFGDTLMQVDQTGAASEFVFSGGTVSPWGSHWMSWTPSSAKLISHEWLRSSRPAIKKSSLSLPTTTLTQFPSSATPQVTDTGTKFQPIDGFNEGSTEPVERWYFFSSNGGGTLTPPPGATDRVVTYAYSDDNRSGCAVQYQQPIDLSSYKGLRIVASADHPVDMEVVVGICDDTIPKERDEACGESAALFSRTLSLTQERQEFLLPFDQFKIHPHILENHPTANLTPNFGGVFDITLHPFGSSGVVEIKEVSAVSQAAPHQVAEVKINGYYFQHPAYVMQGVGDLDGIYALPLKGVSELDTGYAAEDPDGGELSWSVTTSDPGIGAGFQDETLYIWGADANWSGYGEATLTVTDAEGMSDSITIPVTVFRDDKTLINAEGKKDYFVPWAPELDVNRITSVDRFLVEQGESESQLDRAVNFSRSALVKYMKSVTFNENWTDDSEFGDRWSWEAMQTLIDYTLAELAAAGVNWIFWRDPMFMRLRTSNDLIRIYGFDEISRGYGGWRRSTPKHALDYIINRAHSMGISVALGNFLQDVNFGRGDILPRDWDAWWSNYESLGVEEAMWAAERGVDLYVVGESMVMPWTLPGPELAERFRVVIEAVRQQFRGPVAYLDRLVSDVNNASFADWETQYGNLWEYVDFLSDSPWRAGMFPESDPPLDLIVSQIRKYMDMLVVPLIEEYAKPLLFFESHMLSARDMISKFGDFVASGQVTGSPDYEIQERWYRGVFEAMSIYDWFYGHGWYGQDFNSPFYNPGTGPSFRNKPAEDVVRFYYGDGKLPNRAVALDGESLEWTEEDVVWDNPDDATDTERGKLKSVSARQDQLGFFLLIELTEGLKYWLHDGMTLLIDVDGDDHEEYVCRVFRGRHDWVGTVVASSDPFEYVGFVDVAENRSATSFELGIPRRLLRYPSELHISIQTVTNGTRVDSWVEKTIAGIPLDQSEFFEVPVLPLN